MTQSEPLTLTLGFSRSTDCVKLLWPQKRKINIEYLQNQRAPILPLLTVGFPSLATSKCKRFNSVLRFFCFPGSPGSLVLFSWTAQPSSHTGISFFFCQVQEDVCSHQSFLRSLSVPRDLIGIQNVKSHSRKEGRGTGSNEKDECLERHCWPHLTPWIYSLRSRRILPKFRMSRSCRAPEKCQSPCDSHKDGADYSYRGKENGHASEFEPSRSSPGPAPSSCPGVKKAQTHSWVQSKHYQVTGKDEKCWKVLRPDDIFPPLEFLAWTLSWEHFPICTLKW